MIESQRCPKWDIAEIAYRRNTKELTMAKINPIELQKSLKGVDYPAKKDDVVKAAEKNGADSEVLDALKSLSDTTFEKPTDVTKALSGDM